MAFNKILSNLKTMLAGQKWKFFRFSLSLDSHGQLQNEENPQNTQVFIVSLGFMLEFLIH